MSARGYWGNVIAGVFVTAILVAGALYLRAEDEAFRASAIRAEATVVAHADQRSKDRAGDEVIQKFDLYELKTAGGAPARFMSPVTLTQPRREIGASVAALYPPDAPTAARLDDDTRRAMSRVFLCVSPFGLVWSGVFLMLYMKARRPRPTFEASR